MNKLTAVEELYLLAANVYDRVVSCSEHLEVECIRAGVFCEICDKGMQRLYHAPFTKEKQLELLDYLINEKDLQITYSCGPNETINEQVNPYYINSAIKHKVTCVKNGFTYLDIDLETIVAKFIYQIWTTLNDKQKEKVTEILNKEEYL